MKYLVVILVIVFSLSSDGTAAIKLAKTGAGAVTKGPKVGGSYLTSPEPTYKLSCNAKLKFSNCSQSISKDLYYAMNAKVGRCIQKAVDNAITNRRVDVESAIMNGNIHGTGRTGTSRNFFRLHNWRRAADIFSIKVNGKDSLNFSHYQGCLSWKDGSHNKHYRFWAKFRSCWAGSSMRPLSISWEDNSRHCDHIHISKPFSLWYGYSKGIAGI